MPFVFEHKWEYCGENLFVYFQTKETVRNRFYGFNVGRVSVTPKERWDHSPTNRRREWTLRTRRNVRWAGFILNSEENSLCIVAYKTMTGENESKSKTAYRKQSGTSDKLYKSIRCNIWKVCFSGNKFLSYILYLPKYIGM